MVNAGTLLLGAHNTLGTNTDVTINANGTLDASGFTNTLKSLTLNANGTLDLGFTGSAPRLLSINNAMALGGTINISGSSGLGAGPYILATSTGADSGTPTAGTLPSGYHLFNDTANKQLDLVQNQGTIALALGTNAANVHVGGQTVNLLIGNTAASGSASINYTLGGVTGSGTRAPHDSGRGRPHHRNLYRRGPE